MKIRETVLGNGLSRLDVEPICSCERNIPTHVVDDIMRDIIKRKRNYTCCERKVNHPWLDECHTEVPRFTRPTLCEAPRWNRPCAPTKPNREPDGIDIHVDRPLRENFCSRHDWALAMAKYRTLEDVAKDCDWECREPMKGVNERPWAKKTKPSCPQVVAAWCDEDDDWFDWDDDDFEDFGLFHCHHNW